MIRDGDDALSISPSMNDPSLFNEEEQAVQAAEELLGREGPHEISWHACYRELLSNYKKLLGQAKRLVKVSDLMQQNLHATNEQLRSSQEREERLRAQLVHSQKMEAIGTLTRGIAHDFNNLLTIINGYAELALSDTTEHDAGYADLQKILETGRKGSALVQRLLAFSEKPEIKAEPLNLNLAVENVVELMDMTFPNTVKTEVLLAKDLSIVRADAMQVEQVLRNLCVNATEAMPEGGRLRIETGNVVIDEDYCCFRAAAKAGRYVLIEISDTGVGMCKETMNRIFDPFFTTKGWNYKKGTGLGLSVAKGIVEQHGGWITCESEPSRGATFRLYFPVREDPHQDERVESSGR